MRRFRYIILSESAPDIENIWLYQGDLYYYDGGWRLLKDQVNIESVNKQKTIITPVIKLNNTEEDLKNNIKVCSELSTTEVISIDVEGTINNTKYDVVGIYHNGTISILEGNKVTVFDINFNTGLVTIDSKYDTSKLLPYVDLQIGDSESVKAYNKEHLPTGSFFVALDYGYGTGTWNSTTGGLAHIVTAYGNTVYYNIDVDGSVTKTLESPDLYYEYVLAGGKKTATLFILTLKLLVDA